MTREAEIALEVSDDRVFAGVWAYLVIGYWLDDGEGGLGTDPTIDPFSRASQGELLITGSVYVDTCASGRNYSVTPNRAYSHDFQSLFGRRMSNRPIVIERWHSKVHHACRLGGCAA
jgi:hypothetical protein